MSSEESETPNLLNIPTIVIKYIFKFLSYDEIARLRIVSKKMDLICGSLLNLGFRKAERLHARYFKEIRSKLPRRESQRRQHSLGRHCEILTAIETRLSLLNLTFNKFVDLELCCFIPGKVIDEIFKVLRIVKHDNCPPRAHDFLQELRDISSMAIEYFEEHILPTLKTSISNTFNDGTYNDIFSAPSTSPPSFPITAQSSSIGSVLKSPRHRKSNLETLESVPAFNLVVDGVRFTPKNLFFMAKNSSKRVISMQNHVTQYKKVISEQNEKIKVFEKHVESQSEQLQEQEKRIRELQQKQVEYDKKILQLFSAQNRKRKMSQRQNEEEDDEEESFISCSDEEDRRSGPPIKRIKS